MTYRVIHVGTGGWGKSWCERFLPPNISDGLIEVVAAVDMNPQALLNAQQALGLRPDQCFTDLQQAFEQVRADFCTIVVPPAHHEAVVDLALAHDMHILSEKPIADTLDGAIRIAEKVRRAGVHMAVTMSHRFDQDKSTLRHALQSGSAGPLDYLIMRFTCDARRFGTWGHFRHEIPDTLMIEGAVHHLDILAISQAHHVNSCMLKHGTPRGASMAATHKAWLRCALAMGCGRCTRVPKQMQLA